jgi:hypothetical protein
MRNLSWFAIIAALVALVLGSACNPFDDTAAKRDVLKRFVGEWTLTDIVTWPGQDTFTVSTSKLTIKTGEDGGVNFEFDLLYGHEYGPYAVTGKFTNCKVALNYFADKGGYSLTARSDKWLDIDGIVLEYTESGGFSGELEVDKGSIKKFCVSIKSSDSGGYIWIFDTLDKDGGKLASCELKMEKPEAEKETTEPAKPTSEQS